MYFIVCMLSCFKSVSNSSLHPMECFRLLSVFGSLGKNMESLAFPFPHPGNGLEYMSCIGRQDLSPTPTGSPFCSMLLLFPDARMASVVSQLYMGPPDGSHQLPLGFSGRAQVVAVPSCLSWYKGTLSGSWELHGGFLFNSEDSEAEIWKAFLSPSAYWNIFSLALNTNLLNLTLWYWLYVIYQFTLYPNKLVLCR